MKTLQYGALTLRIERDADHTCRADVRARDGRVLAEADTAIAITTQYADLDGDGVPELLMAADSGGSAGHSDSFVLTERPQPALVAKHEGCAMTVHAASDPLNRALATCDLAFVFFESLCNACSPRPLMFFLVRDGKLVPAHHQFVSRYDTHIQEDEQAMPPDDLQAFVASSSADARAYVDSRARGLVLEIAADYLYSGREQRAREALARMWPAWDRHRIFEELRSRIPQGNPPVPGAARYAGSFWRVFTMPPIRPRPMSTSAPVMIHTWLTPRRFAPYASPATTSSVPIR